MTKIASPDADARKLAMTNHLEGAECFSFPIRGLGTREMQGLGTIENILRFTKIFDIYLLFEKGEKNGGKDEHPSKEY